MKKEKKCEKDSQQFYEMGYHYHISAITLWIKVLDYPDYYNPSLYLLRHAIELLLKGIIIKQSGMSFVEVSNNVVFYEGKKKKKITDIHSIKVLWCKFKELNLNNDFLYNYTNAFSEKELNEIDLTIEKYDKVDYNSIYYRYPFKSDGRKTDIEPVRIKKDINVVNELKKYPQYIIEDGEKISSISTQSVSNLKKGQELFDVAEAIFKLYDMV